MNGLYLLIDFAVIIVPLLFSFHPKIRFSAELKHYLPATIISAIIFIVWDSLFTARQIWHFNTKYITGYHILNLPIEEVLFFICIPYACVFTIFCIERFSARLQKLKSSKTTARVLIFLLLITAIIFHDKAYTCVTAVTLAGLLIILNELIKVKWLNRFILIYPVLLIPFFIVNGILTGSWIDEPVVLYNDLENSGIRLGTIPVEDIFYGFELILLNTALYRGFKGILS